MSAKQKFCFPAKRYGLGWSLPGVWQGWAVLVVFYSLLVRGLLAQGERPRWRWGNS